MQKVFEDPLAILEDEARALALCYGVENGREMAATLVCRIIDRMAGTRFYVPSVSARRRQKIHDEIREKFTGANLRQLAKDYGMTSRHIRRILMPAK